MEILQWHHHHYRAEWIAWSLLLTSRSIILRQRRPTRSSFQSMMYAPVHKYFYSNGFSRLHERTAHPYAHPSGNIFHIPHKTKSTNYEEQLVNESKESKISELWYRGGEEEGDLSREMTPTYQTHFLTRYYTYLPPTIRTWNMSRNK